MSPLVPALMFSLSFLSHSMHHSIKYTNYALARTDRLGAYEGKLLCVSLHAGAPNVSWNYSSITQRKEFDRRRLSSLYVCIISYF